MRAVGEAAGGARVDAVGLGVPSVVESASGRVRSSVNVPLADVPLREVLRERLGTAVYVENDATVAALAEAHDERGALDVRQLVMFTIGTGIGGGIVIDGRVYRGATGAAGELGHTIIALDEQASRGEGFPAPGSLEGLAAGHVLDRLAREAALAEPTGPLGGVLARSGVVAGPDLVAAAADGDSRSLAALALVGRRIGIGVANAINTFDPQVVAIGGGVSAAGELLLEPVRAAARQYNLPGVGTATQIRLARSGPAAGVRGAALLARSEHHHDSKGAR